MDYVHYFTEQKNAHHGRAIIKGFGCRSVPVENKQLEKNAFHIIGGLQFGSLDLMIQLRANPQRYLFIDRAYFGGGPGSNMLRVVPDAYQHHWMQIADRGPRKIMAHLSDFEKRGDSIMLVPPSKAIQILFDLDDWEGQMRHTLSQITDRPIFVSVKGDKEPLSQRLARCHAVVTWTSNIAVEAICAGIPAFVSVYSAARPMCYRVDTMTADQIESPMIPEQELRRRWADGLTWGQFSVDEIANGEAKKILWG